MPEFDTIKHLTTFGYLGEAETQSHEAIESAVAAAQQAYGIPVTGDIDPMTERVLARTPRCGVSDAEGLADGQAFWGLDTIAWFVESFPPGIGLTRASFEGAIEKSFGNWAAIIPKDFRKVSRTQDANIVIRTGRGRRSDFDGPGGTLAWMEVCSVRNFRGVLNGAFDGDEPYIVALTGNGIRTENVGTHEIGHALGFMHSRRSGQLMSPTYHPDIVKPQSEDLARAQGVYGVRTTPTPGPTPGPAPGNAPTKIQVLFGDNSVYEFSAPSKAQNKLLIVGTDSAYEFSNPVKLR